MATASHPEQQRQAPPGRFAGGDDARRRQFLEETALRLSALATDVRGLLEALPPDHPRVLEVGCGHGHFLAAYARSHAELSCLGIDYCKSRIERAERKLRRSGLGNLQFLRTEAREFLDVLPPDVRFSRIFLLFPDPWPKKRHGKNRLMSAGFLTRLAGHAVLGALLYFRTDSRAYFEEATQVVGSLAAWAPAPHEAWPFEHSTVFQEKAAGHHSLVAVRTA